MGMDGRGMRMTKWRPERRRPPWAQRRPPWVERRRARQQTWFENNAMAVQVALAVVAGLVAGILLSIMFDPQAGRRRRARTRDKMAKAWHRTARRVARAGRHTVGLVRGKSRAAMHALQPHHYDTSDSVVLGRVESIVFRDPHVPKGAINIDVVEGKAVLRGAVEDEYWIGELEKRVRSVPGVREVENLLHLVGTEAPNKRDALEASNHHVYAEGPISHL